MGARLEPHSAVQRFHTSWFLHPSKHRLGQVGSVPGERRAMLQQGELQQALLRQNGKASEIICNIMCRSLEIYKIQKVGRSKDLPYNYFTVFNTLKFNSVNMFNSY